MRVVRCAQGTAQLRTWVAMVTSRSALVSIRCGLLLQREIKVKQVLYVWACRGWGGELESLQWNFISMHECAIGMVDTIHKHSCTLCFPIHSLYRGARASMDTHINSSLACPTTICSYSVSTQHTTTMPSLLCTVCAIHSLSVFAV